MREYGQIQCSFWTDPEVESLHDQSKLLAAYLLTGPHSNGLGCFKLSDGYILGDLGWSKETVSKRFTQLLEMGFAYRCEKTFFVLIPKFLCWNSIPNPNAAKARMKEVAVIPKKFMYYNELIDSLERFGNHWPNGYVNGFERVSEGVRDNKTKQNKTNHEQTIPKQKGAEIFKPPSIEDVSAYCVERKNSINPEQFIDHYQANGWIRGKAKIKDWKACVRTWESNSKGKSNETSSVDNFSKKDYTTGATDGCFGPGGFLGPDSEGQ